MQIRRVFFPIRRSCFIVFRASFSTAGVDGNGDDDACASLHAEQVRSAVLSLAEEAPSGSVQDRLAATKALRAALAKAAVAAGSQRRVLQSDEDPNSPEQIDVYFNSRKLRLSDLHAHLLSLVAVGADVEAYVDDVLQGGMGPLGLIVATAHLKFRPEKNNIQDDCWQLMQTCWDHDPEKRPTVKAVINELNRIILTTI